MRLPEPVRIGWESVKANSVPMVVLWTMAAALAAGYYLSPAVSGLLGPLSRWQTENGWLAAFLNRVGFCGLLPGALLLTVRRLRPKRLVLTILSYCLWAGCWGVACDAFFNLQERVFGSGRDVLTLFQKTLVDQLIWNVFLCTPANALFFPWVANDFQRIANPGLSAFVCKRCAVMLVSNWVVWLPVMAMVYAFPLPLQIQLVGLAGCFWMLVALKAAAKGGKIK